jgi:endonuclease/exonuclease/phosphatase family metal-dependent hydrolase
LTQKLLSSSAVVQPGILLYVRLATFNVLHGRPMRDGRPDDSAEPSAQPLADAVAALDADVLALQEVDRLQDRSGRADQALVAAQAMGAADWRFATATAKADVTVYSAREADRSQPAFGIALLTRRPVLDWRVKRLAPAPAALPMPMPVVGRPGLVMHHDHPRVALAAVLEGRRGPFTVAATHLSFVPPWNAAELIAIRRWLADLPRPHLLLGDLNLPGPVPRLVLGPGWRDLASAPTYPAHRPRLQIDHVLAAGLTRAAVRGADGATPVIPVSDHRPLLVDLDL